MDRFAEIAGRCLPFGRDRATLVDLLERPNSAGVWPNLALDRWLRENWQRRPTRERLDRFLACGRPPSNDPAG